MRLMIAFLVLTSATGVFLNAIILCQIMAQYANKPLLAYTSFALNIFATLVLVKLGLYLMIDEESKNETVKSKKDI